MHQRAVHDSAEPSSENMRLEKVQIGGSDGNEQCENDIENGEEAASPHDVHPLYALERGEEIHPLYMDVPVFKEHEHHHDEGNSLNAEEDDRHHHHAGG